MTGTVCRRCGKVRRISPDPCDNPEHPVGGAQSCEWGPSAAPISDDLVERCAVAAFCAATGAREVEWRGDDVDRDLWRRIARAAAEECAMTLTPVDAFGFAAFAANVWGNILLARKSERG